MPRPLSLVPEDRARRVAPRVLLFRMAAAYLRNHAEHGGTIERTAEKMFGDDTLQIVLRAATSPASTTGTEWADVLAAAMVSDFVQSIASVSAEAALIERGTRVSLDGVGSVRVPGRTTNPQVAAQWVGEGFAAPLKMVPLVPGPTLKQNKLVTLTSFTREQVDSSNIEVFVRTALSEALALSLDAKMFSADAASSVAPAGLLAGVAPLAATAGGGVNAMAGDIKALAAALAVAGAGAAPVIVAAVGEAMSLKLTAGPQFDVPVLASSPLPSGTVIMVEASSFVSGFGATPEFMTSKATMIHEADPAAPLVDGGTMAAPVRSLFQTQS
jgi:hypothetical protein